MLDYGRTARRPDGKWQINRNHKLFLSMLQILKNQCLQAIEKKLKVCTVIRNYPDDIVV